MAGSTQFLYPHRENTDTILIALDFPGNTDIMVCSFSVATWGPSSRISREYPYSISPDPTRESKGTASHHQAWPHAEKGMNYLLSGKKGGRIAVA
jgi:hypothetical protein